MALVLFSPNNMTNDTTPSPFVTAGDPLNYPAWRLFNNGFTWGTGSCGTSMPVWWSIDVGAGNERILASYTIASTTDNNLIYLQRYPRAVTVYGSNNGTTWDTIDQKTGMPNWVAGEVRSYTPDVMTTAYRYFKIQITDALSGDYPAIAEWGLYYDDAPPPPAGGSAMNNQFFVILLAGGGGGR